MITDQEKEEIISKAVERALLILPEVVGSLITEHTTLLRVNKEFYEKYPQFKDHKDVVASVIESVEARELGQDYKTILEDSIGEINRRIKLVRNLDKKTAKRPNLRINGEL